MQTWATLVHKLKYKKDIDDKYGSLTAQLRKCADDITSVDYDMSAIRDVVMYPEAKDFGASCFIERCSPNNPQEHHSTRPTHPPYATVCHPQTEQQDQNKKHAHQQTSTQQKARHPHHTNPTNQHNPNEPCYTQHSHHDQTQNHNAHTQKHDHQAPNENAHHTQDTPAKKAQNAPTQPHASDQPTEPSHDQEHHHEPYENHAHEISSTPTPFWQ